MKNWPLKNIKQYATLLPDVANTSKTKTMPSFFVSPNSCREIIVLPGFLAATS